MNIAQVENILSILSGVQISRIKDGKAMMTLLKDYASLRKIAKESADERNEIVLKFQADWKDELKEVAKSRENNEPVKGHDAFLEAERVANKALSDLLSAEVELSLKPVAIDAILGVSDITLEQAAVLVDCGLAKM